MDETELNLRRALRHLADDEAGVGATLRVEANLRAHVRSLASEVRLKPDTTRPPTSHQLPAWRTYLAGAAALAIFVMVWRFVPAQAPAPVPATAVAPMERAEFLPLPYAHVPTSGGQIVRMSVPRESLASFGLDPGNPGGPDAVLADVFVGSDGIARAVRFVGPDIHEESRP